MIPFLFLNKILIAFHCQQNLAFLCMIYAYHYHDLMMYGRPINYIEHESEAGLLVNDIYQHFPMDGPLGQKGPQHTLAAVTIC